MRSGNYLNELIDQSIAMRPDEKPLLWVLMNGAPAAFPIGLAAVRGCVDDDADGGADPAEPNATFYEIYFWVRSGYRTTEVGHGVLDGLIRTIILELAGPDAIGPQYLMTRFPKAGGAANSLVLRVLDGVLQRPRFPQLLAQTGRGREGVATPSADLVTDSTASDAARSRPASFPRR